MRRTAVWGLLGGVLLALIYAHAVVLNLGGGVIGGNGDGFENLWNNWWVRKSLLDLHQSPFFTDYIYYPTGVSLRFHTLNPFDGLVTMPFSLVLGLVPTLNLFFLASLALSVFCAFLLIRDLVGDSWAAFAGAAVYTYANEHVVAFFSQGQSEKLSMEWLPLYLFFMLRAVHGRPVWEGGVIKERDKRRWPVYLTLAVAVLVVMSLVDWQYVMFSAFVTGMYLLFVLVTRRTIEEKRVIGVKLVGIGVVYALLVFPTLLLPMIREAAASPWLNVSGQAVWHSIDLARLLGPGGLGNPGYLVAAVAAWGLWVAFRQRRSERGTALFWGIAIVVFYLLALGPTLQFDGRDTGIPMPYGVMQDLPVISSGRNPGRFSLVALLGLGVLAALGLREIYRFVSKKLGTGGALNRSAVTAVVGVVFVGVTLGGFVRAVGAATVDTPDWPPFYQQIADDEDDYAILELPMFTDLGLGEQHYQVFQVMHNKPRFSGRWARDHKLTNPDNFVKHASLFRQLLYMGYDREQFKVAYPDVDFLQRTDLREQGSRILGYYGVRYVVLYKDALGASLLSDYVTVLRNILGETAEPFYEDGRMVVYRTDGSTTEGGSTLTLDVGDGWFKAETNPEGKVYRWADSRDGQQSELYTMNLTESAVKARLTFTAYTWKLERTVTVKLNGADEASILLKPEEGEREYDVEMSILPGNNMISFSSAEPPQPTGEPNDSRELSFGMYGVTLDGEP